RDLDCDTGKGLLRCRALQADGVVAGEAQFTQRRQEARVAADGEGAVNAIAQTGTPQVVRNPGQRSRRRVRQHDDVGILVPGVTIEDCNDGRHASGPLHQVGGALLDCGYFGITSYTTLPPTIVISGLMSLISSAGTVR